VRSPSLVRRFDPEDATTGDRVPTGEPDRSEPDYLAPGVIRTPTLRSTSSKGESGRAAGDPLGRIVTFQLQGGRPVVASLGHVDAMRMRDILSVPFGDVSERLARLVGLALRRDGVDVERVQTVSSGEPVYVAADSMVPDVARALRGKEVRLLPVLDGICLLGFVDVSALARWSARELRMGAVR
jgi:hypothetical protein